MSSAARPQVLVANLSAPEFNHLAVELERRGQLWHYVRPYVNKRRWSERVLERVPGVGGQLGRRLPPVGLPSDKIVGAGVVSDLAAAAVGQLSFMPQSWTRRRAHALLFAAERSVARRAGSLAAGADVIAASYGTARYAFEVARRSGGRCVLNYPIAHNRYQQQLYQEEAQLAPEFAAALPRLDRLPREYSERLEVECALADCILVGSSFARKSFIELGYDARKLMIVPYGVDTERFCPPATPRRAPGFRVLFVGQIGQRKGVGYLLRAYRQFRKRDSELHLVGSYGPGPATYLCDRDLYRHTPHVAQHQLPALIRAADVLVLPSLVEGLGLVVLEAMACGVPVIVSTHGPADVVRDGIDGYLVPIRDPEAIAQRLECLYSDPDLRQSMGSAARQQALRYDWGRYAQRAADALSTDN